MILLPLFVSSSLLTSLFVLFLSLCFSACSSLQIFLYTMEGKPLICTRASAWVLELELEQGYLLASAFLPTVHHGTIEFQIVRE